MHSRIKEVRTDHGLSQAAFAERIELSENFVMMIERGMRNPSKRTIAKICSVFGINENWLVTGSGKKEVPKTRIQEVQEIAQKALEDTTPDKRERISNLITRVVGGMTDGEIDMLFELCKRHGYIKE